MHYRLPLIFAAVAVVANNDCSDGNCDAEDLSTLMSVQLLQTERHITKAKAADSEILADIKRDFADFVDSTKHIFNADLSDVHNAHHNLAQRRQDPTELPAMGGAAAETGVAGNADDDIYAFISALIANVVTITGCVCIFMVLRGRFPQIYSNNVYGKQQCAPVIPPEGMWGWASAAWYTPMEESAKGIGLDNALLLKFCELCMKILVSLCAAFPATN